ncbi:MAG: peptide chain release factor N(5)-glutamine methyltransferase [Phycisphaerales bacterium]|nr:peptide chain release factor N(5)-glutamine methyltransferase [Phycisphaerales bacterium]
MAQAAGTGPDTWTTRTLLEWIEGHLANKEVQEPLITSRWLVAHVIGTDPIHLYTDLDRPASPDELGQLRSLVQRAAQHEPVQYMLGEAGFLGRHFSVTPAVLIPRTATELLVQIFDTWWRHLDPEMRPDPIHIADIGTGSGCIAISVALQRPEAIVIAADLQSDALEVAAANVERHGVSDRVTLVTADACAGLEGRGQKGRFHAILSNPPYIDDQRYAQLDPNVQQHEPEVALRGGADGLEVVRQVIAQAPEHLLPGGLLAIEVDDHHADTARSLLEQAGLQDARVVTDEHGDDRFVVGSQGD